MLDANTLYGGDNLDLLARYVPDQAVDLVYLDPPFKSDRKYRIRGSHGSPADAEAFDDTWRWDTASRATLERAPLLGERIAAALHALRHFLGESALLAYLAMMAPRLVQLHRVLNKTGTIYVHCDPTASHYLKLLMDAVFGPQNMRNEIIWCYRGGGVPKRDFARKHDVILRYSKSNDYFFDVDAVRIPYSEDVLNSLPSRYDKSYRANKVYAGYRPHPAGKHPEDWWPIQAILPSSGERLGYPTQKPVALMHRIIKASSAPRSLVLDPFCGSGTTLVVAEQLQRRWIGIDVSAAALHLAETRLRQACAHASFQIVRGSAEEAPQT